MNTLTLAPKYVPADIADLRRRNGQIERFSEYMIEFICADAIVSVFTAILITVPK
ncbi:hypothetical protein MMU07_05720 [Aquiflexum sp. LQ15W]|uniref:hypothetical protein n=1 Tax=Cognataquiflexum nitidum TaxID=2922272 RepID=UPI001F132192|nr:hypothetical protein [Cognataquiflexum nitidum]MCH6199063.1 hypothetical protein [Cognataquiflexum nitidum]